MTAVRSTKYILYNLSVGDAVPLCAENGRGPSVRGVAAFGGEVPKKLPKDFAPQGPFTPRWSDVGINVCHILCLFLVGLRRTFGGPQKLRSTTGSVPLKKGERDKKWSTSSTSPFPLHTAGEDESFPRPLRLIWLRCGVHLER
jgi:hypothetical protein